MWNKAAAPNIPEQSIFIDGSTDEKKQFRPDRLQSQIHPATEISPRLITTGGKNGDDYKWVPNINFTHLLTQFTFQVIAAKKQSEADKEAAQKLK
mgnify:CR=1 FL=1